MYSYTATKANYISPPGQNEPALRIKCKCQRTLIQQQIYTCLSCANYSCHFCTVPQFTSLQCRNCKYACQPTAFKNIRCKTCFACPYCESVLTITKDPKTKLFIMVCQFCYWSTKDVNIKQDKVQGLIEALTKASMNLKLNQIKIYSHAYHFMKESNSKLERENHLFKYAYSSHKKLPTSFESLKNLSNIDQSMNMSSTLPSLHKFQIEQQIMKLGLQEQSEQYKGQIQYPLGLPLLAKRTRRCPQCKKPLTTFYRNRGNQYKIQLMHKDLKIIQCQRNAPFKTEDGYKVKIKFVRQAQLQGQKCEQDQIKTVSVDKQFRVSIKIENKAKITSLDVDYTFIVETNIKQPVQNPIKVQIQQENSKSQIKQ